MVTRYAQSADRGNDVDIVLPLVAGDGGERFRRDSGLAAIREFLLDTHAFIGWTLHFMATPAVDVATGGKTAKAFWYLRETAKMSDPDRREPEATSIGGTYEADLVKETEGEWKYTYLRLNPKLMSLYTHDWSKRQLPD